MGFEIEDSKIHLGHRARMRKKMSLYGADIFDTYQLLEMLLYNVVPVKDTSPMAKRLLKRFGSLDGVFSAKREELMEVEGVGAAVACYIHNVGMLPYILFGDSEAQIIKFESTKEIGEYFIRQLTDRDKSVVMMVMVDNAMRLLETSVVYECDYDRGNVREERFLEIAMSLGAAGVAIAHNHSFGSPYPSYSDLLTDKNVCRAFAHSGVKYLGHFVISGGKYSYMDNTKYVPSIHDDIANDFRHAQEEQFRLEEERRSRR